MRLMMYLALLTAHFSYAQENINPSRDSLQIDPLLIPLIDTALAPFYHGVASGDPTNNSVIIWTRITPEKELEELPVMWEISENRFFDPIIKRGSSSTGKFRDYTVKVDVTGVESGNRYFYRFSYDGKFSSTGTTKTLPENPQKMNIAFASCSNYEWGYFNAYGIMAKDTTLDLVVHLGDYIYEYGVGKYGDTTIGRLNVPSKEIVSLQDYRTRYSLYRLDKDLNKVHESLPFVTTWDDHEIANNSYMHGAENHQSDTEGNWTDRRAAGTKAYYEWLPIREPSAALYRSFGIGSLINLVILDTRITGRTEQIYDHTDEAYKNESRSILGQRQLEWLKTELQSHHYWKIIGNQVPVGPMIVPTREGKHPYMDGWDGYPAERNRVLHYIKNKQIKNVAIVTGDYHSAFAMETPFSDTSVAVEFVVPSINSSNYDEHTDSATVVQAKNAYLAYNPHISYCNLQDHGYVKLKINKESILSEFVYITTKTEPDHSVKSTNRFEVLSNSNKISEQ